ncbi:hypothetical protein LXA43DRAFT_1105454 [Ganoderma leucocontextum]|nr:hypothetical protein LXA43DRAFT_1105454 [Ganoderma leucocontextum]
MNDGLHNPNHPPLFYSDSDLDAALADLENYVSNTGGHPLAHPPYFTGNAAPPAALQHHIPLHNIPPVQNIPNPMYQHFGDAQAFDARPQAFVAYPGLELGNQQLQPSQMFKDPPPPPPATPTASDSASNAGRKGRKTAATASKATPNVQSVASGRRSQAAAKDKAPPAAPTPKASGKGSKAGVANRRDPGASDDEIEGLSEAAKENAGLPRTTGLTDDEKYKVVEYLTDERRWSQFKVKQLTYFDELVKIFDKRVKLTQISNFWHGQAWAKYKACRESLVKHTGGGDPDDPGLMSESDEEPDLPELPASAQGRVFFKRKIDGDFSHSTLRKFLHSKLYAMIHKVAHADNSVKRKRARDSASVISDDESPRKRTKRGGSEDDSDADSPLHDALAFMKKRAQTQEATTRAQLDIAQRREEREQREFDIRQDLQTREVRLKERQTYLQMVQSGDPDLIALGKRGILKLENAESLEA